MTTQRLYYDDSYTTQFTAHIVEQLSVNDRPAVILDRTYFYPTSGGQPYDTGTINGTLVMDVSVRDDDGAVIHILEQPVTHDEINGQVEWSRRFDHMQHHTGQHILTQAFVQIAAAKTVGFHLSPDTVTIDLDTDALSDEIIDRSEDLANQVIYENRAVQAKLRQMGDQEGVRVRRLPRHILTEGLRVIEIEGFDITACGGTHVAHTGEIGLIKIVKTEKRSAKTRVEFRCGERALRDYREKNRVAYQLAADLNCRFSEAPQLLGNLREDLKAAQSAIKAVTTQLIEYEAIQLLSSEMNRSETAIIIKAFEDRDPVELKLLVSRLVENPKTIALCATVATDKSHFFFARSGDLTVDIGKLLKETLSGLDGRGGGQPNFAQGGAAKLNIGAIDDALQESALKLRQIL